MICAKIDILKVLKEKGYNTTVLQREKFLSSGTIVNLRESFEYGSELTLTLPVLNRICLMTGLEPGELIEERPTDEEKIKYSVSVRSAETGLRKEALMSKVVKSPAEKGGRWSRKSNPHCIRYRLLKRRLSRSLPTARERLGSAKISPYHAR